MFICFCSLFTLLLYVHMSTLLYVAFNRVNTYLLKQSFAILLSLTSFAVLQFLEGGCGGITVGTTAAAHYCTCTFYYMTIHERDENDNEDDDDDEDEDNGPQLTEEQQHLIALVDALERRHSR